MNKNVYITINIRNPQTKFEYCIFIDYISFIILPHTKSRNGILYFIWDLNLTFLGTFDQSLVGRWCFTNATNEHEWWPFNYLHHMPFIWDGSTEVVTILNYIIVVAPIFINLCSIKYVVFTFVCIHCTQLSVEFFRITLPFHNE